MNQYRIEAGTGQHIGDRDEQQDRVALFAAPRAPGYAMAVIADGMGGVSGGALAADQVVRTAKQAFDLFSPQTDRIETLLETIGQDAHTIIRLSAISSEKHPHSTMVILVITPERSAIWAHVGDSRLYRFDGPNCSERTVDDTYAERLVKEGRLSAQEAREHQLSNVLVNALGMSTEKPYVTIRRHDGLKAGDAFLLCTDGLWHYFSDTELGAAIAMNAPRQAAEMLIAKAQERAAGSSADNCTLAIVKLTETAPEKKHYSAQKMRRAV
jgi:serine/threonine protein phosphatase PrpC